MFLVFELTFGDLAGHMDANIQSEPWIPVSYEVGHMGTKKRADGVGTLNSTTVSLTSTF